MDEFQSRPPDSRVAAPPGLVLLTQTGFSLVLMLVCSMLFVLIAQAAAWDVNALQTRFDSNAPFDVRQQMRFMLGLSHLGIFLTAGILTLRLYYPGRSGIYPEWYRIAGLAKAPGWRNSALAVLWVCVAMPMVIFLINLNNQIPVPDSLRASETQMMEAVKGLMVMSNPLELMCNLLIVAILPAVGEELVFRGVVQKQLFRLIPNPLTAIALGAVIFSLAHFQFDGFIARAFLGFLLGWLYWKSGSLWLSIIAHLFNNGIQVLGQFLFIQGLSILDFEKDIDVPWYLAVFSIMLIWLIAKLFKFQKTSWEPVSS